MRVLLEFGSNLGIFAYCFSSFLRVLLECGSYSRVGLFQGFMVTALERFAVELQWNYSEMTVI